MTTSWVQAIKVQSKILSTDKKQEQLEKVDKKKILKIYSIKFPWLNT
jgi:hypothetical protein